MSVLVLDKPTGVTSFDLVRQARRWLVRLKGVKEGRRIKIGHGGTLDPMATGVLPICVGEATKLAPFLLDADKVYEATVRLGVETDTLDADGTTVAERPVTGVTEAQVRASLTSFLGAIDQVPPMFSALKRAGRPLYDYARAGETVDRAPRRVVIRELVLLAWQPPDRFSFRVRCSKGTYVRVLAADLGHAIGLGAHLVALRRTGSGPFSLDQALTPSEVDRRLETGEALPFVALEEALAHLPAVMVNGDLAREIFQGKKPAWTELGVPAEPGVLVGLRRPDGSLLAVAEPRWLTPTEPAYVGTLRVFNQEASPAGVDQEQTGEERQP